MNALNKEFEMKKGSTEDKDDILIENLNTALFLFLGILSVSVSVIVLIHSASIAVYSQKLSMDFLNSSIFAAFLFAVGFGSLHIFRNRRESRKKKESAIF